MNRAYLGIDIGTSSVKVICRYDNGETQKARMKYDEISPEGWYNAVIKALSELDLSAVAAIGLSSQVGTYIIDENEVIMWNDSIGKTELDEVRASYEPEVFIDEISMPHPQIASYPIPRLKYIQKNKGNRRRVCQPKDYVGERLTGRLATDKYSWRGLANFESCHYSERFLSEVGYPKLPPIIMPTEMLGTVRENVAKAVGLPLNTPVFTGLNDFFASLMGMGIFERGNMFDITGTSEHLGVICEDISPDTNMVSGPYLYDYVHYGVTASSGAALDFGIDNFELKKLSLNKDIIRSAPVFCPYLKGERAPIFDGNASGTFLGIDSDCTKEMLAYSVLEGVAFSIYHIYELLGTPRAESLRVSGGAAKDTNLNLLKATLFSVPVTVLEEEDTSALGAAMVAAVGIGAFSDEKSAAKAFCRIKGVIMPDDSLRELLLKRYEVYKKIYPALKDTYGKFKEVQL